MKIRKIALYILVVFPLTMPLRAQDPLSLTQALEIALEKNYGLIISRADVEIAQINNNWGTAGRYPTIGFDASDRIGYELESSTTANRVSAGVGLNWLLFDGFSVNITTIP